MGSEKAGVKRGQLGAPIRTAAMQPDETRGLPTRPAVVKPPAPSPPPTVQQPKTK